MSGYFPPPGGGSGGAAAPDNWVAINLATSHTLTAASPHYRYLPADLTIAAQSGDNFSIIEDPFFLTGSHLAAVHSNVGGRFQAALYCNAFVGGNVIDGSSTEQRWVWLGYSPGNSDNTDPTHVVTGFGFDDIIPVFPDSAVDAGFGAHCKASGIGYTPDGGGVCLWFLSAHLINGVTGDAVLLDTGPNMLLVWQV